SQTLYLRGFVGADYESFQWNPPGDEEWFTYAQSMGFSRQQAQDIYSLPVFAVSAENVLELSMDFPPAPAFTYLPLAGQGDSISLSESNRLSGRSSQGHWSSLSSYSGYHGYGISGKFFSEQPGT